MTGSAAGGSGGSSDGCTVPAGVAVTYLGTEMSFSVSNRMTFDMREHNTCGQVSGNLHRSADPARRPPSRTPPSRHDSPAKGSAGVQIAPRTARQNCEYQRFEFARDRAALSNSHKCDHPRQLIHRINPRIMPRQHRKTQRSPPVLPPSVTHRCGIPGAGVRVSPSPTDPACRSPHTPPHGPTPAPARPLEPPAFRYVRPPGRGPRRPARIPWHRCGISRSASRPPPTDRPPPGPGP